MRAPLSWIKRVRGTPRRESRRADVAEKLIGVGLEVETVDEVTVTGPLLVGRVLEIEELAEFKKPIRYCQVESADGSAGIICGATQLRRG